MFLSYSHLFSLDSRYVIFTLLNLPFNETYDVFLVSPCPKQFHEESKTSRVPPISIHRLSRNIDKWCNYHKCAIFNAKDLSARYIMQRIVILSKEKIHFMDFPDLWFNTLLHSFLIQVLYVEPKLCALHFTLYRTSPSSCLSMRLYGFFFFFFFFVPYPLNS